MLQNYPNRKTFGFFDYLLYALAGSSMIAMSFSFLLWLTC